MWEKSDSKYNKRERSERWQSGEKKRLETLKVGTGCVKLQVLFFLNAEEHSGK